MTIANNCPECWTDLDTIASAMYLCADWTEVDRIVTIVRRSIIVKVRDSAPMRVHVDGRRVDRSDIRPYGHGTDFWFSANGLRLEAVRLTWGDSAGVPAPDHFEEDQQTP
jgi:hypothetical protein